MDSDFNHARSEAFVGVAVERQLMSRRLARDLLEQSRQERINASELASSRGDLRPVDVDIIEAFMAPKDLAPGYELIDVLGSGALGIVFRARQAHLRRDVAIKSIIKSRLSQQNVVARFQQEGAAIGQLQHPNIVSAIDLGTHRNRFYLVMELVDGEDLRSRLNREPVDSVTALSIMRQTAAGLQHALSQQIIHRDIKPGNLILTSAPAGFDLPPGVPLVKIADFGLARIASLGEEADSDTRLTLTGAALGTPMYCAPEQLTGDHIDHRADIYALGATLFHALSGKSPFKAETGSKVIAAKINGDPPRMELLPDDLDPRIRELIVQMMAHDPNDRIADYETLIRRIDQIQVPTAQNQNQRHRNLDLDAHPKDTTRTNRRSRRSLIIAIAISAVVIPAIAFLGVHSNRRAELLVPDMTPTSRIPLFDGRGINGWTQQRGVWFPDQDQEGAAVLVGRQSIVRRLPAQSVGVDGFGVEIGIDLLDAQSAEVHFGFLGGDADTAKRFCARLTSTECSLGTRDGIEGSFKLIGAPISVSPGNSDSPNYQRITLERRGQVWVVHLEGKRVNAVEAETPPNYPSATTPMIQLVAAEGTVNFADLYAYGLRAAQTTADP